jgi:hypothetical protein
MFSSLLLINPFLMALRTAVVVVDDGDDGDDDDDDDDDDGDEDFFPGHT